MNKNSIVAIALSGGIDSLVSGYLLKKQYKHVFGIHFTTGYEKLSIDLKSLENQLGFPVKNINLSKEFEKKVVQYFIKTYLDGKTPNPCIICNKEIKFGELLKHAQNMGADYIATGHYANIVNKAFLNEAFLNETFLNEKKNQTLTQNSHDCYLEKGKDPLKDQSYFLSMLSKNQLEKIIFPLSSMTKHQVKQFAKSKNIKPVHKKESQDICFIHDNDFAKFILKKQQYRPKPGNILNVDNKIAGQHNGLHKFTVGQRRGINCPAKEPYYVQKIDVKNNILKVCFKKDLLKKKLKISDIVWNGTRNGTRNGIRNDNRNLQISDKKMVIKDIITKIRYSHKGGLSTLSLNKTCGEVVFNEPQNAITPGQAAVFYNGNRVLGAGIIQ